MTDDSLLPNLAVGSVREAAADVLDKLLVFCKNLPIPAGEEYIQLKDVIGQARHATAEIGIVGVTGHGKSTLVNALLGQRIVYSGAEIATSHIVRIRYGDPRVELQTAEDIQIRPLDALCELGHRGGDVIDKAAHITAFCQSSLLENGLCLVDTPGLDAGLGHESDDATAEGYLQEAGLIVLAIRADKPGTARAFDFLEQAHQAGMDAIIAVTAADLLDEEELEESLETVRRIARQRTKENIHVFPIAADHVLVDGAADEEAYQWHENLTASLVNRSQQWNRFLLRRCLTAVETAGEGVRKRLQQDYETSVVKVTRLQQEHAKSKSEIQTLWNEVNEQVARYRLEMDDIESETRQLLASHRQKATSDALAFLAANDIPRVNQFLTSTVNTSITICANNVCQDATRRLEEWVEAIIEDISQTIPEVKLYIIEFPKITVVDPQRFSQHEPVLHREEDCCSFCGARKSTWWDSSNDRCAKCGIQCTKWGEAHHEPVLHQKHGRSVNDINSKTEITLLTPKSVSISALPSGFWAHLGDPQDHTRKAVASAEITARMRDALNNFESRFCTAMQGAAVHIIENLETALSVVRTSLEEPTTTVAALLWEAKEHVSETRTWLEKLQLAVHDARRKLLLIAVYDALEQGVCGEVVGFAEAYRKLQKDEDVNTFEYALCGRLATNHTQSHDLSEELLSYRLHMIAALMFAQNRQGSQAVRQWKLALSLLAKGDMKLGAERPRRQEYRYMARYCASHLREIGQAQEWFRMMDVDPFRDWVKKERIALALITGEIQEIRDCLQDSPIDVDLSGKGQDHAIVCLGYYVTNAPLPSNENSSAELRSSGIDLLWRASKHLDVQRDAPTMARAVSEDASLVRHIAARLKTRADLSETEASLVNRAFPHLTSAEARIPASAQMLLESFLSA